LLSFDPAKYQSKKFVLAIILILHDHKVFQVFPSKREDCNKKVRRKVIKVLKEKEGMTAIK